MICMTSKIGKFLNFSHFLPWQIIIICLIFLLSIATFILGLSYDQNISNFLYIKNYASLSDIFVLTNGFIVIVPNLLVIFCLVIIGVYLGKKYHKAFYILSIFLVFLLCLVRKFFGIYGVLFEIFLSFSNNKHTIDEVPGLNFLLIGVACIVVALCLIISHFVFVKKSTEQLFPLFIRSIVCLASVVFLAALVTILKKIWARSRPFTVLGGDTASNLANRVASSELHLKWSAFWQIGLQKDQVYAVSFPSGHTLAACCLLLFILLFTAIEFSKLSKRFQVVYIALNSLAFLLLPWTMVGRVQGGWHWTTDVSMTAIFSILLILFASTASKKIQKKWG